MFLGISFNTLFYLRKILCSFSTTRAVTTRLGYPVNYIQMRPSLITAVKVRREVRTFRRSLFSPSCPNGGSGMFLKMLVII